MAGKLLDLSSAVVRVQHQKNNGYTYVRIFQWETIDEGVRTPPVDIGLSLSAENRSELIKLLQEE